MAARGFDTQLIGYAERNAPERVVGDRVIGLFHRVLAETAGESDHGEGENEEDQISRVVPAGMAAIAIGAETRPEQLDLHPYPRENSDDANKNRAPTCREGE